MKVFFATILFLTTICSKSQNLPADNNKINDLLKIDSLIRVLNHSYSCDISYKSNKITVNTEGYLDFSPKDTVAMKKFSDEYFQSSFTTVKLLFDLLTKHKFIGLTTIDYSPSTLIITKKGHKGKQTGYLVQPSKNTSPPKLNDKNSFYKVSVLTANERIALVERK